MNDPDNNINVNNNFNCYINKTQHVDCYLNNYGLCIKKIKLKILYYIKLENI